MDYNTLAWLARASYCKDDKSLTIGNFEKKAIDNLSYINKYHDNVLDGWEVVYADKALLGFQGVAYGKDTNGDEIYDEIVIAYAGTNSLGDTVSDIQLATDNILQQATPALAFYEKALQEAANAGCNNPTIRIVGHSLGGALAQYVASYKNKTGVSYNAPGVPMPSGGGTNVVNFVNLNDFVGSANNDKRIGETRYYFPTEGFETNILGPHSLYYDKNFNPNNYKVNNYLAQLWDGFMGAACAYYHEGNNLGPGTALAYENILEKAVNILQNYYVPYNTLDKPLVFETGTRKYYIGKNTDELIAGKNISTINAGDLLYGNGGDDTINGYAGKDTIYGGDGDDVIFGGSGTDYLYGESGSDLIAGDSGNDAIYGGSGNDTLEGGRGEDTLCGNSGNNSMEGGRGFDIYYSNGGDQIYDSDQHGALIYNGSIKYMAQKPNEYSNYWRDSQGIKYFYSGLDLMVGSTKILNFKNGDLGIYLYEEDGTLSDNPDGSNESDPDDGSGEGGNPNPDGEGENPNPDGEGENPDEEIPEEDLNEELTDDELDDVENPGLTFHLRAEHNEELNEADRLDALPSDPLIFDLDGDGKISLTDLDNGTNFDIDNDGFAQKISWVSGQDGILVLDRNNNGKIDNGLELFGENTVTSEGTNAKGGIDALSDLDSNSNGIIDANDAQFSSLKFLKADGTLVSLQDAGISQIILQYNEVSNADEHGNVMVKSASFVKTDGSVHKYGEFMLNQNHYESIHIDKLELPESYDNLPEVQGTGLVMSLKQAMVRDTSGELLETLESILEEEDLSQKRQLVETLLYKWAGTENVSLSGRGLADGRKLATIEKFVGRYFLNEEGSQVDREHVKHVLEESWNRLFDYVYAQLAVQTHGTELLAHIGIAYKNNAWVVNGGDSLAYFEEIIADDTSENKMHSKILIRDFGTILHQYNYADNFENLTEYIAQMQNLLGEEYVEMFVAGVSDEAWTNYWDITYADGIIYGGNGDDNIRAASDADNLFHGGDGNDALQGRNGNDTFYGGAGNDKITTLGGDE